MNSHLLRLSESFSRPLASQRGCLSPYRRAVLLALLTGGLTFAWLPMARAQDSATLATIYSFTGGSDGSNPTGGLVQGSDGNFYGTTSTGGSGGDGTVFQLTPSGVLNTLHSFSGSDGATPKGGLVQGSDGNFYGTTQGGGNNGNASSPTGEGTVYRISAAGVFMILHTFNGSDGSSPSGGLVQGSDGNFYGTTQGGGAGLDASGTVFQITPAGVLTTLHSFGLDDSQGSYPSGGLVQGSDGNFYGVASQGGNGLSGTVFRITLSGEVTTLYSFPYFGSDFYVGAPVGSLVEGANGNFYGTAAGGSGPAVVFEVTPAGVTSTVHTFDNSDGSPNGNLILGSDGNFYGTTLTAAYDNSTAYGAVYQFTPAGGFTFLHRFPADEHIGPQPGLVRGTDGNFYGVTTSVYTNPGTVFRLNVLPPPTFFAGEAALSAGVYYLAFSNGNYFGYYSFLSDPAYIDHFDLGCEYVFDANDGSSGVYLYDFASSDFFYTSPTFPFPYLYDFNLQSVVYYYPDPNSAGHYTTNPRYFYDFNTGQIISK